MSISNSFQNNNELDEETLAKEVDLVMEQGAEGIIPTGSVAEFSHLTDKERACAKLKRR